MQLASVAKALTGALAAGLASLSAGLTDGSMSPSEWVTVAVAVLVAFSAVWAVPNRQA